MIGSQKADRNELLVTIAPRTDDYKSSQLHKSFSYTDNNWEKWNKWTVELHTYPLSLPPYLFLFSALSWITAWIVQVGQDSNRFSVEQDEKEQHSLTPCIQRRKHKLHLNITFYSDASITFSARKCNTMGASEDIQYKGLCCFEYSSLV